MATQHTPGPWHIGMKPGPMIYGPKGEQVADLRFPLETTENGANAALIVCAVNSHADLVAAVQAFIETADLNGGCPSGYGEVAILARAALAKVLQS